MSDSARELGESTRRNLLLGAAAAGIAVPVLSGCGSSGSGGSANSDGNAAGGDTAQPTTVKVSDIPVGGGRIYPDQQIVVTQPTAGTFEAFSAVCTHEGCIVTEVSDGFITCPCHGSMFAISSGIPTKSSLARAALPKKKVTDSGGTLTVS